MSGEKAFIVNIHSRVAVGAALGVGLVAGAGTAYLLSRLNEHTRLTHQISSLHATIMEVKRDIALLETGLAQKDADWDEEELDQICDRSKASLCPSPSTSSRVSSRPSSRASFRKKTVSFSSSMSAATSASYHTAPGYDTDTSYHTAPGYETDTSRATDTDYFSPDEDDDEFFDLSPEDSEKTITYMGIDQIETNEDERELAVLVSVEEAHLAHLLQQVDELSDGSAHDQTQAFHILCSEVDQNSENAEYLWRLAKATKNMAAIEEKADNLSEKRTLIFDAYNHAERALEIGPTNAEIHKWFGILSGMRGEYLGMGERIKSGNVFKTHIDQALQLRPQDATLHHLLGRFCYEVSQLTWIERKAAAALFGEVPMSTFDEALKHFQAAEDLRPAGWKENRLFQAKCHLQLGNLDTTAVWLDRAKEAPLITPDDEIVHKEVLDLHRKYS